MENYLTLIQLKEIHAYRRTFISLRNSSNITRQQVLFLALLVAHGMLNNIRVMDLVPLGISYNSARQYMIRLEGIGFASKQGRFWAVTPLAMQYYKDFTQTYHRMVVSPFSWK